MEPDYWVPIMGTSLAIRASALDERTAQANHGGQTIKRLTERGGLAPCEVVAVLRKKPWESIDDKRCATILAALTKEPLNET